MTSQQHSGPDIFQYLQERSADLESLTPSELRAFDELNTIIQKNIDTFESKQDFIVTESNQYERQYTSFFAVSISFIIAGLLSAMPETSATLANKVFYSASILSALIAAAFLFLEYRYATRFYDKWLGTTSDILEYINHGNWKNPDELTTWIASKQASTSKRSTTLVFKIEVTLIGLAFACSGMWLIEALFNPDWLPYL